MNKLEQKVFDWVMAEEENQLNDGGENYCQTRDIFQSGLDKMVNSLLNEKKISEDDVYILAAIAGEIGNNSFDHNLGSWPDIMGVFFGYELAADELKIVLADRGQGLLATLKRVKPELKNDGQALFTAFNEKISGRAPEPRGNGLKFVKENIKDKKMNLLFMSGFARAELNDKMIIKPADKNIKGSLAIISYQYAR
ncbi:MAG: hypothetical protein HYV53_03505 [Parcubacteria group bacterium]|nr:hypothetical protein [Parcubacteria group bacterium]